MKVIRFISSTELIAVARDGQVSPLHDRWVSHFGNGVKKDKPCLWFYPYNNDSYAYGFHSPDYRLRYLHGIVAEESHILNGKPTTFYICLHLDLPKKDLTTDTQSYADPEGSFFAKIYVAEFLLHRPYQKSEIKKVEIYADEDFWDFKLLKTLTIDEAALLIAPLLKTPPMSMSDLTTRPLKWYNTRHEKQTISTAFARAEEEPSPLPPHLQKLQGDTATLQV